MNAQELFSALGQRAIDHIARMPEGNYKPAELADRQRFAIGMAIAETVAAALDAPSWGAIVARLAKHPEMPDEGWPVLLAGIRDRAPLPCACGHTVTDHDEYDLDDFGRPGECYHGPRTNSDDCGCDGWTESKPPGPGTLIIGDVR